MNALDPFGNLATSYGGAVTVSVASGSGGIVSGTLTVTCVGGVANYADIVIQKADTYTLRAQSGSIAIVSVAFSVHVATASHIEFSSQPGDATAGTAIPSFTVSVHDAFNNVVTDYSGFVTIGKASGPGSITSGTLTRPVVGGVATFNDIVIQQSGALYVVGRKRRIDRGHIVKLQCDGRGGGKHWLHDAADHGHGRIGDSDVCRIGARLLWQCGRQL